MRQSLIFRTVLLFWAAAASCHAFVVPNRIVGRPLTSLEAKKKKKGGKPKGFGKLVAEEAKPLKKADIAASEEQRSRQRQQQQQQTVLQSVETGGSNAVPVLEESDDGQSPEERTKRILREKYGLKTLDEQQMDAKQLEQLSEQRKKMSEWKKMADAGQDFDLMAMLPAPVLIAIDRFLKIGVGVTGVAFVLAGLGITLEAWSKTSGNPLPEDIDAFIVNTIEPNFTTGLLVLLGFSVSLGVFAAAQLGSEGAQYKEDR